MFCRIEIKSTTLPDKCQEPVKGATDVVQMIGVLLSQLDTSQGPIEKGNFD